MTVPLLVYCLLIVAASILGGWIPLVVKLTHRRMQLIVSFIAGMMFGVGLLHMLPHAMEKIPIKPAMYSLIGGFLVMFFIERFFCFHHHDAPDDEESDHAASCSHSQHDHDNEHPHGHKLTWSGAAIGMTLHSLIGGVALASAVAGGMGVGEHTIAWPGIAAFAVILLHKPFDALTVLTLAKIGNLSKFHSHLINALFSLAVPLGAVLFTIGFSSVLESSSTFIGYALAFSAGTFLCISLSDLLPELQFHHHDRLGLSGALLGGLIVAWGFGLLEHTQHDHSGHNHAPAAVQVD